MLRRLGFSFLAANIVALLFRACKNIHIDNQKDIGYTDLVVVLLWVFALFATCLLVRDVFHDHLVQVEDGIQATVRTIFDLVLALFSQWIFCEYVMIPCIMQFVIDGRGAEDALNAFFACFSLVLSWITLLVISLTSVWDGLNDEDKATDDGDREDDGKMVGSLEE